MKLSWDQALAARKSGIRFAKFPAKDDPRAGWPDFTPSFSMRQGARVFTIGSCFARNIERKLSGYDVPTLRFSVPQEEAPHSSNTLLNEYNPGTMAQRIMFALDDKKLPDETIVPEKDDGFADLSLPGGFPVSYERALQRRGEIDAIYSDLKSSELAIITLGLVEAWIDNLTGLYLNRMPPRSSLDSEPNRFSFHRLGFEESFNLLKGALDALTKSGVHTLVTVSPVPLSTTFSGQDCITANEYSKAVLRVCAEDICKNNPKIDYFPSFEIVRGIGSDAYIDDNIHVKPEIVAKITDYMISRYREPAAA